MKWNLKTRILVPTLILTLLLTLALSLASQKLGSSAVEDATLAQLNSICSSGLQQVETWIDVQRKNLEVLAARPDFGTALSANSEHARAEVNAELARVKGTYGFFEDLILADATGNVVAASNADQINTLNVSDRGYFKDALRGTGVLSPVLKSRISGKPIVVVAAPVLAGGKVTGVLCGLLDLNWFGRKFVDNIRVLETGYVFMFDESGTFIAHPDATKVLTTRLQDFDWAAPILATPAGSLDYVFNGEAKSAVFRKSETLGWGLVATVSDVEILAPIKRMQWINLALGAGAFAAALGVMFVTARSIARPLLHAATQLAAGATQTSAAAGQVSAASQSLAEGTSEQAASLEETSASLEEINSMTRRNAEHAGNATALARETRTAAENGQQQMGAMINAMADIKGSADNIAKIVKSIDEIAFQTNLLALNAAVEAARAGEAGAGFAVVAEEVRSLAHRAASAAKETAEKIEDSIQKSTNGVNVSRLAAESLNEIASRARRMDELVAEIATASTEQTKGLAQISAAVAQMDQVTQSNAGTAEETAAAAEELSAQAETTAGIVKDLNQLVTGASAIATADAPRARSSSHSPASASAALRQPVLTRSTVRKPSAAATAAPRASAKRATADVDAHFIS